MFLLSAKNKCFLHGFYGLSQAGVADTEMEVITNEQTEAMQTILKRVGSDSVSPGKKNINRYNHILVEQPHTSHELTLVVHGLAFIAGLRHKWTENLDRSTPGTAISFFRSCLPM